MKRKTISINIGPILKQEYSRLPNKVIITKKKLQQAIRYEAQDLKTHFSQRGAWDIRAEGYAVSILKSFFKVDLDAFINYALLKELGPDIVLTRCKSKYNNESFWGFSKKRKKWRCLSENHGTRSRNESTK